MSEHAANPNLNVNPHIIAWCEQTEASLAAQGIGVHVDTWLQTSIQDKLDHLENLVGNTPLRPVPELPGVLLKEEYQNVDGSHYGRAVLQTLRALLDNDQLQPGMKFRDMTTGSAGIAFPFFTKLLGDDYPVRILAPDELPASRVYPMQYFGAHVERTGPGYIQRTSDTQAAEIIAMIRSRQWRRFQLGNSAISAAVFFTHKTTGAQVCYPNHSENEASVVAHQHMAEEMVGQLATPPKAVALAEGNFTTITGITRVLRKYWPQTKIFGVVPSPDSPLDNFGLLVPDLKIPLRFRNPALLDGEIVVSHAEREAMRDRINRHRSVTEQLGNSSLLTLVAAEKLSVTLGGATLTLAYDQAMRY